MEFIKCHFAFFMTVISFLCSETTGYKASRVWEQLQTVEDDIYFVRKDIKTLFDITNQLNLSAVEGCSLCISGNKRSGPPVMNHDGRRDMVKVNINNVLIKYQSLIKAFVTEKRINRQLQDQVRSMENIISASDREVKSRLQSIEGAISASEKVASKKDLEIKSLLQSMGQSIEDTVADIYRDLRKNMTLMITESERMADERDREVQSRLRSVKTNISTYEKMANEREQELQDQLQSMKALLEDKIADIDRDLHNNMTSFMTKISDRIDEHLLKAETTSVKPDITTVPIVDTNCATVPESGVYTLYLQLIMSPVTVYCDQDTDGGGWIVFMRRQDGSVNFDRSWSEYKHGFGSPDGELWAGNEFLYKLTKERPMQLRIDMEDFDGNAAFAVYEEFQVGAEEDKYRLHVSGYSGTAGDSLIDTLSVSNHVGMQFSTFDSDNDNFSGKCAKQYKGGWWYNWCGAARLNGQYSHNKNVESGQSVIWYSWRGWNESLKRVEMKIR